MAIITNLDVEMAKQKMSLPPPIPTVTTSVNE